VNRGSAVLSLGRALVQRNHAAQLATAGGLTGDLRIAHRPPGTKSLGQPRGQRRAGRHEQAQVDRRLVGHPHTPVVRVGGAQPAGDLRRGPVLSELARDQPGHPWPLGQSAPFRAQRPVPRGRVRGLSAVSLPAAVTPDLPADSGRRPPQPGRDHPNRLTDRHPTGDLLPFRRAQRKPGPAPRHRRDPAPGGDHMVNRAGHLPQRPPDLRQRLALTPAPLQLLLLLTRHTRPTHSRHPSPPIHQSTSSVAPTD